MDAYFIRGDSVCLASVHGWAAHVWQVIAYSYSVCVNVCMHVCLCVCVNAQDMYTQDCGTPEF